MTQDILMTRIPLIHVIAVDGTFVLNIFWLFRVNEKQRRISRKISTKKRNWLCYQEMVEQPQIAQHNFKNLM